VLTQRGLIGDERRFVLLRDRTCCLDRSLGVSAGAQLRQRVNTDQQKNEHHHNSDAHALHGRTESAWWKMLRGSELPFTRCKRG